jgi:hypothetical protein
MSSERPSRRLRRLVAERALWRCEYCHSPSAFSTQPFELDHVIPRSKQGSMIPDNLALSCACNSYKGNRTHDRDPLTGRVVRLFNPRSQRWPRHFKWIDDGQVIIGRTAAGRATVQALRLNRPELLRLRRALDAIGEHPRKFDCI